MSTPPLNQYPNQLDELTVANLEQELSELAAYHVGLFAGAASRIDPESATVAHALFLLIEEALARRREWGALADA